MYILGIETSCDETSCAVLKNYKVLSNITISSLNEHKKYGGVIPEIATRAHLSNIDKVLKTAQRCSRVALEKINLVSVTCRPGLIGALAVGVNFAKALSVSLKVPFIGVNHLHAHIFSPFLNYRRRLKFPFLGVVVSGGHTEIYRVDEFNKISVLGRTRDDACGEAFDKVAKVYGLGYPGGPKLDKLFNDEYKQIFKFKCGKIGLDLSFSGIKTALVYKKKEIEEEALTLKLKSKILSSFQYAAIEAIIAVILEAVEKTNIKTIACGGGVIANSYLRRRLEEEGKKGLKFLVAPYEYSGDNAAMVAGLGFYLYNNKGISDSINLDFQAN